LELPRHKRICVDKSAISLLRLSLSVFQIPLYEDLLRMTKGQGGILRWNVGEPKEEKE
jgi:hypothetical protein